MPLAHGSRPGSHGEPALGRVDELEPSALQLRREVEHVRLHPRDVGPALARDVERLARDVDAGDEPSELRKLSRRLARPALEVEHAPPAGAPRAPTGRRRAVRAVHSSPRPACDAPRPRHAGSGLDGSIDPPNRTPSQIFQAGKRSRRRRRSSGRRSSSSAAHRGTGPRRRCRSPRPSGPPACGACVVEHLLPVREVLERLGLDDPARHGVHADPAAGRARPRGSGRPTRAPPSTSRRARSSRARATSQARDPTIAAPVALTARRRARATAARGRSRSRPVPVLVLGLERGPDDAGRRAVHERVQPAERGDLVWTRVERDVAPHEHRLGPALAPLSATASAARSLRR